MTHRRYDKQKRTELNRTERDRNVVKNIVCMCSTHIGRGQDLKPVPLRVRSPFSSQGTASTIDTVHLYANRPQIDTTPDLQQDCTYQGTPFGPGCPPLRFAPALRAAPVGRLATIPAAPPRFSRFSATPGPTRRPASLRSLRLRGASVVSPSVVPHCACYGYGHCVQPAAATANQPPRPALHSLRASGSIALRRTPSAQSRRPLPAP